MIYQTKPGFLYIPCKRGDGILAENKPKQLRLFDGMCGGYIDPEDWTVPPILSEYTQGETLWIEIKKTQTAKDWAIKAGRPQYEPTNGLAVSDKYRRMSNFIDFNALAPYVNSQAPDFLNKIWKHKCYIPVIKLNSIPNDTIKDAQQIDINAILKKDVGQITAGTYTVGPAAGDNYPTFGGAGGAYAALGNLTGNLTFRNTGNITETASATITEDLGGFDLLNTSDNPHYGDPTGGWLIQINFLGNMFDMQEEDTAGGSTFEACHLYTRRIAVNDATNRMYYMSFIDNAHTISLHDLLLDGNAGKGRQLVRKSDAAPTLHVYNCVGWDASTHNFLNAAANANDVFENIAAYNSSFNNIQWQSQNAGTVRNCTAYGATNADYNNIDGCTGRYNVSSDATAADVNWGAGFGNITNAIVANDVQSVNDADTSFFDITSGGALDGAGEVNALNRTVCIRNRVVPGPNGTSIGPAEVPWPAADGRTLKPRLPFGMGMGVGW